MDLKERYEKLCADVIDCSYDDEGNILPDSLTLLNQTFKVYAEYRKAEATEADASAKIEAARIQAEASNKETEARIESARLESESRIEAARIQAEATMEEAKVRAMSSGIEGGIGAMVDIVKVISNAINMKSVIWAEESANKILSSKYLGFIKKQP